MSTLTEETVKKMKRRMLDVPPGARKYIEKQTNKYFESEKCKCTTEVLRELEKRILKEDPKSNMFAQLSWRYNCVQLVKRRAMARASLDEKNSNPQHGDPAHSQSMDEPHSQSMDEPHSQSMDEPHSQSMDEPHSQFMDEPHSQFMDEIEHAVTRKPAPLVTLQQERGNASRVIRDSREHASACPMEGHAVVTIGQMTEVKGAPITAANLSRGFSEPTQTGFGEARVIFHGKVYGFVRKNCTMCAHGVVSTGTLDLNSAQSVMNTHELVSVPVLRIRILIDFLETLREEYQLEKEKKQRETTAVRLALKKNAIEQIEAAVVYLVSFRGLRIGQLILSYCNDVLLAARQLFTTEQAKVADVLEQLEAIYNRIATSDEYIQNAKECEKTLEEECEIALASTCALSPRVTQRSGTWPETIVKDLKEHGVEVQLCLALKRIVVPKGYHCSTEFMYVVHLETQTQLNELPKKLLMAMHTMGIMVVYRNSNPSFARIGCTIPDPTKREGAPGVQCNTMRFIELEHVGKRSEAGRVLDRIFNATTREEVNGLITASVAGKFFQCKKVTKPEFFKNWHGTLNSDMVGVLLPKIAEKRVVELMEERTQQR